MKVFDRRRLAGAWMLRSWVFTDPDGTEGEPLGPGAEGLLVFTADGWATITIAAAGRQRFSRRNPRAVPVEERAAAFDTFVNYCCRWRVVGHTVELSVRLAQNPGMVGTTQVRRLQMRGRTLTVSSEEPVPGGVRVHRLVWRPAQVDGQLLAPRKTASTKRGKRT